VSVKPHFDATLTINATLPSNSLRFTVASVPRRFAEKSYAPFMTTASTARREETDAWREPELSANPLADETKSVPAARRRSINLETAFLDVHFPGRFLRTTGSWYTPADCGLAGEERQIRYKRFARRYAAQIRYLVYLRTRHIHVSMHMSPYLLGHHHHSYLHYLPHIHIACTCAMPTSTCPREAARRSRDADAARSRLQISAASYSKSPQRAKAAARWHRHREHARLRSLAGA